MRGDSKVLPAPAFGVAGGSSSPSATSLAADDMPRRSSVESSRSSAKANAPAPPPPRRPHHQNRPSQNSMPQISPGHLGSPSAISLPSPLAHVSNDAASLYSVSSDAPPVPPHSRHSALSPIHSKTFPISQSASPVSPPTGTDSKDPSSGKLSSPPPPPPTRNPSTRRPQSASSDMGITPRKVSREGAAPPPPPKRGLRNRGDSKGSDTVTPTRRDSFEVKASVPEEDSTDSGNKVGDGAVPPNESHANEILADLDALQKEVDALRGRYEQVGQSVGGAPD